MECAVVMIMERGTLWLGDCGGCGGRVSVCGVVDWSVGV